MTNNFEPVRIAILGSRGIPANYGGYETVTQELSIGLVKKGFAVYVACEAKDFKRNPYATFHGVNLVYFPIINSLRNISDVLLYDFLSVIWATLNVDIIYMLSYTNSPLLLLPRLFGKIVVVNADGLEWKRRKHSGLLRSILRSFEAIGTKTVNFMVVDSKALGTYFQNNYKITPVYLPYGVAEIPPLDPINLERYNLKPNDYYLVIARLEPENNISLILDEFEKSNSKKKLIIVGPVKNTAYVRGLLRHKSKKIIFTGGIYEPRAQRMLRHNCYAYIHGHEVGGTNPTLIEALSCHSLILALNVPFNKEVAGEGAFYFTMEKGDLMNKIIFVENKENIAKCEFARKIAYDRYRSKYLIKGMVDASADLFSMMIRS